MDPSGPFPTWALISEEDLSSRCKLSYNALPLDPSLDLPKTAEIRYPGDIRDLGDLGPTLRLRDELKQSFPHLGFNTSGRYIQSL